ncbi:response regulator transcription factor [Nocardia sp. N2S4-5]|uniref:response regulator transcription factor n=1 Tax=Nocardia sp. N2S4-5 TaxID=3351565 RepID=UPI0037D52D98
MSEIGSGVAELVVRAGGDPELRARLIRLQRHTENATAALQAARRADGDRGEDIADALTPREYDVLRLVATGGTNGEIGARLGLSNNTVKSYLRAVMQKLQARNRAQAVANARRHGLL